MKVIGTVFVLLAMVFIVWGISAEIFADYEYDNQIASYWSLSEKASTLDKKAEYLDKFVSSIEDSKLGGNNALFLKTPDNSVEQNMIALHSLQTRMHEIRGMDVQSFQYQQAISQITAQEQGEAGHLLEVIQGAWYLNHHVFLWDWIDVIKWLAIFVFGIVGVVLIAVD